MATGKFECMLASMREAAKKHPMPEGVTLNSDASPKSSPYFEDEVGELTANLVLQLIDVKMRTLTINKYLAQAGPYPGVSVAWGNQPLYDPNYDESITRATADKYIGLSVAAEWPEYYNLYDETGIYMIRTGAGEDTPPSPIAIGLPQIIEVLGNAIDSLAPYFATAPGDNYVIRGNMMCYYLQNSLKNPITGAIYDFPNLVIWWLNPNGRIALEMDIYDLVSAGQIINGFFNDLLGGPNSGLGRPASLLPVPAPPGAGPLPSLKSLDDFQKQMTISHRLIQRAKTPMVVPNGNSKIFTNVYPLAEVRNALNNHLLSGNLLRVMVAYYLQMRSDVIYLPNDLEFTVGRLALQAKQDAVLASMPNVKINRIDWYTIKGNQCTLWVWFDMVGKSGALYTAPKVIQLYYGGNGQWALQEDFLDQVFFNREIAAAVADQ